MARRIHVPSYRLHKQSGQAVVTLRDALTGVRRDVLLGKFSSPVSRAEYARVVGEWEASGRRLSAASSAAVDITVAEVILAFLNYAEGHYSAEGRETVQFKHSLRALRERYGATPAQAFGPKALKAVRQVMADGGLCRNVVNRSVARIKTLFKWATEEELIPGGVYAALRAVRRLPPNAPGVRHTHAVVPVFWKDVLPAIPFCPSPVAAMLELQWLTGMRSGEVRIMRTLDLDRTDPGCWLYRPGSDQGEYGRHKNAWRGQSRVVSLGPKGIAVLSPWLRDDDPAAYLFSPAHSEAERNAKRRAERQTPMTPSHRRRTTASKKKARRRPPGEYYRCDGYAGAVRRACALAGISFHPYQLRHGRKMVVVREAGSDAARAVLGQKTIESTTHYGALDVETAKAVMERMG
jgi:integrase